MLLFEVERIFVVILVLNCLRCKSEEDENLRRFTGTLEGFDNKPVDLVFLLDESGSITAPVFPQEVTFMEFIGRHITISASTTRVAVVTFSTGYREHFNYIQNSVGNNMCTFILDSSKIDYKGGRTNTGAALKFAGDLLQRGRSNAEKVIILISDGQSNDGDATLNAAVELKNNKNIIFAVGVADVNEEELNTVASGKNYTYILKGFRYEDILKATEQLKKDTKELSWDPADSGSCEWFCGKEDKYCCDSNARCSCGTKGGIYECVCNPGFTGLGRKGNCFPCPKGTYSSDSTKANCKPCPDHSTTRYERSTSTKDCYCLPGYEGDPARNLPCKAVKCAKLLSPEGGTVLPDQCGNTFNSTCTFKCYEGHCPYSCNNVNNTDVPPWFIEPKEPRKCLENKTWSGIEFYCEKIKCSSLNFPKSGKHNCSGSDFRFGTICHMQCNKGYILHGSEMRQCQLSGEWNGKDTICKAVECPRLKQNRLLSVEPKQCHTHPNKYGTACRYYCEKGYELVSASNSTGKEDIGLRKCQADGKWSGVKDITCKDNSPPQLECPSDIQVDTDKGKSTAQLYWQLPKAEDNIEVTKLKVLYPPKLNKPPYAFNIGTTKVTYVAEDRSGLNATCSFQVTVKDTEDPIIKFCPNDITKEHGERKGISITWKEPEFLDNSGMKLRTIFQTHKSGDQFSWGQPVSVLYSVSDPSGNTANCSFFVTIKPYPCKYSPPPLNGAITCDKWLQGQLCAVHCEEGYNFIQEPEDTYFCLQQGNSSLWGRLPSLKKKKEPFQFPWPDCGKKSPLKNFKMRVKLSYYSGACPSKSATIQMKKHFITLVKEYSYLKGLCPEETCIPENVVVKCGQRTESGINYILNRKKRNNRNISINGFNEWEPQFDMYINETSKLDSDGKQHRFKREEQGNSFVIEIFLDIPILTNETESSESCEECGDQYYDSIAQKLKKLQLLSVPELSQYVPGLSPIYNNTSFVQIPECDIGQVVRNMSCVNCPLGMFFNENISECLPCPVGKFQDTEALTFCKECPSEFSTVKEKSKSIEECKKFCPPGSYSDTGLETCRACPIGTYQHLPGQTYCNICDEGTTTWKIGSSSLADCTTKCPPGTYSDTGFHPCTPCPFGTYQSLNQQTECILCADGLTTLREGAHAPEYCRVVDHCKDLMPCMNGGTCTNAGNAYICLCLDGFKGRNCEINIDDCTYDLCLNNGTCIDEINDYSCACLAGFTGQMCEININDCHSESCFHGGTCIDGINKFVCKCSNGFTGDRCEINYYDCASDPCQNGGTCFDQAGGFRCCCAKEYTGQFCEQKIQECDNIDCYNGGTCVDKFGGFECLCKEGYEGKQCERNTDDCQIQPCKNNGVCIDGISNYTCQCPPTHEGYHCEKELSFKFGIKFPEAVVSNYVKLHNKRSLSALTVSFWMRTDYKDKLNRGTPISYSFWDPIIRKEVDNALTLLDVNKFVFYLHGKEFHTSIIANSDHNWHHCVITWESISGSWLLYWDGVVRSRGSGVAVNGRFWSGYFVLGQEQDSIGTAFSTLESYKGEISQFNVWDHVLSSQSIQELKNKCGLFGNVIAWTDIHHNLHGSIIPIENIDLCSEIGECTEEDCYCVHATKSENENCWRIIPSCEPNPCDRGQRCIARYNGTSECKCKLGFEGIFCQYDIDECQTNNGNCSHFCVNTPGSYYCSCPVGMRLASDKCNCIDISYCNHDGLIYLNGDTWIRKCKECQCIQGEIICTRKQCPKMECKENENEVIFPGECCGSCFGGYSSCILHHEKFHTFDNLKYSFSGNCRYSLMDDCFDGEFSVQYEDLKPKTKQKTLYLYIHCLEIQIIVPGVVLVNGDKVNIPYRSSSLVHITSVSENNSSTLFIFTTHKIIIEWRSSGRIEIKVPPKYKKQICGLCGNFNGKEIDDFQTKQHLPARTVKDMGLSWKVNGYEHCRNISSKTPSNPIRITHYNTCRTSSYHMQQKARKQCSLLKQRAFRPCYKHIDPRPYYKLCLEDSCSCMYNEQCYCDSIMAYMAECKRNKISIKHSKSLTHCAMECRGGTVYDECGPACVETCRMDLTTSSCHNELCVPGCHCPAGMALHNGICIYKSQCPT